MATQIIAKLESTYRPTPDSEIEHSSTTYRFEAGMFHSKQWEQILSYRGTTVDCQQNFPEVLANLFMDILAGEELEEIEAEPEVTFIVVFPAFDEDTFHPLGAVNRIRAFLNKPPYQG